MPSWPNPPGEDFPQHASWYGYTEPVPKLSIWQEMDTGPPKVRKRYTAAPRYLTMGLEGMSLDNVDTLDDFFLSDCAGGSVAFDWEHPRDPSPLVAVELLWTAEPIIEPSSGGTLWRATLQVLVQPS